MMAPRRSGAGVSRPRQMGPKKGSVAQFAVIGVIVVVVVVGLLLVMGGRPSKEPSPRSKSKGAAQPKSGRSERSFGSVARKARSSRGLEKARRREERQQRREEARAAGSRTARSSSGGYSRGSSSRSSSSPRSTTDPAQLRAIVTDGSGARFALVGNRQYKSGDELEGRRILEVGTDAVKMEYRQNTYTVKVGQRVY